MLLTIINSRCFKDTSDMILVAKLCCDVQPLKSNVVKIIDFVIPPSSERSISLGALFGFEESTADVLSQALGISKEELAYATEMWLEVSAVKASAYTGNGSIRENDKITHISLEHRFFISVLNDLRRSPANFFIASAVSASQNQRDMSVSISWANGACAIVDSCGYLVNWKDPRGFSVLSSEVDISLFRAPTDNDCGGSLISYYSRWKAAGIKTLHRTQIRISMEIITSSMGRDDKDKLIEVVVKCKLKPSADAIMRFELPLVVKYLFKPDGGVIINLDITGLSSLPPLPRIGIKFAVPASLSRADWFGLGPHEAYDDRKACVRLGTFSSDVESLHVPYIVPQENGRRADPRY
jgi:hypothetical protein